MAATNINLGCGPVFVDSPDWINLAYTLGTPRLCRANLIGRLPGCLVQSPAEALAASLAGPPPCYVRMGRAQ